MRNHKINEYFECLGEIWRDLTSIEFLMRACISKKDGEINKFPLPPYTKGKVYTDYPDAFGNYSFEIIVQKFNKRFPRIKIPQEVIDLRNGMAHGLMVQVGDGNEQVIKFHQQDDKTLKVEFQMGLEISRLKQIRQSLKEIRRFIGKQANDSTQIL